MTVLPIGSLPSSGPTSGPSPAPTSDKPKTARLSRRRLLQIAAAGTFIACTPKAGPSAQVVDGVVPWPGDLRVPPVFAPGYGMFPDYDAIGETGPWPKILGDTHKRQLERFSDLILPGGDGVPAPSEIGIAEFFDDWTSAPYPWMTDTRRIVHHGFAWLDAQMEHDHGADWLGATDVQARAQLDRMRAAAANGAAGTGVPLDQPANMYTQLRGLIIGAYYTTPEGEADLGHVPNVPLTGDYPGPTGAALDHILGVISAQGLATDDLPIGPPPYDGVRPYVFTGDEPA